MSDNTPNSFAPIPNPLDVFLHTQKCVDYAVKTALAHGNYHCTDTCGTSRRAAKAQLDAEGVELTTLRAQLTEAQAALEAERTAREQAERVSEERVGTIDCLIAERERARCVTMEANEAREQAEQGRSIANQQIIELQADLANELIAKRAAERELQQIDCILDRRDALVDQPTREAKILKLLRVAKIADPKDISGKLEAAEARNADLQRDLRAAQAEAETLRGQVKRLREALEKIRVDAKQRGVPLQTLIDIERACVAALVAMQPVKESDHA